MREPLARLGTISNTLTEAILSEGQSNPGLDSRLRGNDGSGTEAGFEIVS